mmetsp:Transcript_40487/g.131076  ORF Transcript_40487/g.131076 Transcript_40487/m.131076 type:complete len:208 (-) Transcript_40487:685-1308(-)
MEAARRRASQRRQRDDQHLGRRRERGGRHPGPANRRPARDAGALPEPAGRDRGVARLRRDGLREGRRLDAARLQQVRARALLHGQRQFARPPERRLVRALHDWSGRALLRLRPSRLVLVLAPPVWRRRLRLPHAVGGDAQAWRAAARAVQGPVRRSLLRVAACALGQLDVRGGRVQRLLRQLHVWQGRLPGRARREPRRRLLRGEHL